MNKWPLQSECRDFYGAPNSPDWESRNIVSTPLCGFTLYMDDIIVTRIRIHRKCQQSLMRVLAECKTYFQMMPDDDWQREYSGSLAYRSMRGKRALSMHAYGCAIDLAASTNPQHHAGKFTADNPIVKAFEGEGWVWGGRWHGRDIDPMHFQAARVG